MTRVSVITDSGAEWFLHRYEGETRVEPDADGQTTGYRVTPGTNLSRKAKSFDTRAEAAAFLRANRDWGARFSPGGCGSPQNIFSENILIDGKPR